MLRLQAWVVPEIQRGGKGSNCLSDQGKLVDCVNSQEHKFLGHATE